MDLANELQLKVFQPCNFDSVTRVDGNLGCYQCTPARVMAKVLSFSLGIANTLFCFFVACGMTLFANYLFALSFNPMCIELMLKISSMTLS